MIKARETEMKMKIETVPIFVTVESTEVDGVTRHHVKKGFNGCQKRIPSECQSDAITAL